MKDTDIIKALECCADLKNSCKICPFRDNGCQYLLAKESLKLINRQKAEIEKWKDCHSNAMEALRQAGEINKDLQAEIKRLNCLTESMMHFSKMGWR